MHTLKRMVPCALIALVVIGVGCSAESKKSRLLSRADSYFDAGEFDKAKIEYLGVLRLDPENARAIQRLGTIWYDQGAPLRAAPFLLKARELLPDDIDSRLKLASVFMAVGQFGDARSEALAILERSPAHEATLPLLIDASRSQEERDDAEQRLRSLNASDKPGFHIALAAIALGKKDLATATSEAKQALALDPHSIEAHLALAKIYWLQNDLPSADREFKAAAELAPPKSVARFIYGEFKARTGRVAEAKVHLGDITREAPDSLPAWRLLAQIALGEKQFDESLKLNENILLRDPVNIEALLLQAQIWLAKGDVKKGVEALERLNTAYPELPLVKYDLARVYLQTNEATKAAALLNQLLEASPENLDAALLLGEANLRNGNAQQVVTSMLDLLKKRPDLTAGQVLLAQAYQALDRLDDAAGVFRDQVKASPKSAQPYLMLGLVLRQQNKVDEARKALEDAQRLAPGNLLIVSHLVDLDLQKREFEAALQRVQAELEKTPQSPGARFLEGKIYAAQQQWDRAEAALLKALELDSNSSIARDLLVSTYLAANKLPQAIQQLENFLSKNPDNARALMLLALTHERMSEFAKAKDAYEKLLAITPESVSALNNLAYLYAERLGELDKALELAQKVRALQPGNPAIADTLGWTLYKRGDYNQALPLLQESARNLPDNPEIKFHLGMANYMMGRKEEARDAFRQAAAATDFPGREEAERRLAMLSDVESKETPVPGPESPGGLKEQSHDPLAQVRLAESYEKQGSFDKAAEAYRRQ